MCDNPEHDHDGLDPLELIRNTDSGQEVMAIVIATVLSVLADHAERKLTTPPMSMLAELCVVVSEKIGNPDGVELAKFVQISVETTMAEIWERVEEIDGTISWNFLGRDDEDDLGQGA